MEKIKLIEKIGETLEIKDVKIIEDGFHSLALFINNEFVFRFPLEKEFFIEYINEEKLLNIIKPYIQSTKIPDLKIYNVDNQVFSKHKIIKGETFFKINNQLNELNKKEIAINLAEFLSELHNIKTDKIEIKQFSANDYEIKENVNILYNYLKYKDKIDIFNKVMNDFESESKNLSESNTVICHNDLNENNILIDPKTKKLSGIIDFGDNSKRELSAEFSTLMKYDYDFVIKIIEEYQKLTKHDVNLKYSILLQKIRCYGGILWFIKTNKIDRVLRCENWLNYLNKYL